MTSSAPPSRVRLLPWAAWLLVIAVAPLLVSRGFFLSLLCRIGVMTVFALSYNMLLGQTGLLSFGHAVYYGLGAFAALHALNAAAASGLHLPVTLLPLVGGAAGMLFGLVFGYVITRRAGTTFAMISLGIGEMVSQSSLMFPGFFGGEGGVSGNRVTGKGLFGITYGSQLQVYYLIAAWAVLCAAAIYALSQTPLGRLANAVRDNPERVQFIGYDPRWIRYGMVVLAGFFAGVAGALSGLQYEIVTAEALSDYTSGIVILMAFVGGTGSFTGPMIGAALITVLQVAVAGVTPAWPFYFGLFFLLIVLYAPGGIASILAEHRAVWRAGLLGKLAKGYALAALPAALLGCGVVAMVEMAYAQVNAAERGTTRLQLLFVPLDGGSRASWLGALGVAAVGLFLLGRALRIVAVGWQAVHAALQAGPAARGAAAPAVAR